MMFQCLQVVVTYTEAEARALGLGPEEVTPPQLTQSLTAQAGAYHKLRLPAVDMSLRTVLNAGTLGRRRVVPRTVLSILDR